MLVTTGNIFRIINYLLLVSLWAISIFIFAKLPEEIPVHFNLQGEVDDWGSKKTIWYLTGIGTALFILLQYLSRNPNVPGLNIPESMRKNPSLTYLFVQVMCFFTILLFGEIQVQTVAVAMYFPVSFRYLSLWLLILMFVVMFAFIIYAGKQDTPQPSKKDLFP